METAVTCVVSVNSKVHVPTCDMASSIQARRQPSDDVRFWTFFHGSKIGVLSGCLGKPRFLN